MWSSGEADIWKNNYYLCFWSCIYICWKNMYIYIPSCIWNNNIYTRNLGLLLLEMNISLVLKVNVSLILILILKRKKKLTFTDNEYSFINISFSPSYKGSCTIYCYKNILSKAMTHMIVLCDMNINLKTKQTWESAFLQLDKGKQRTPRNLLWHTFVNDTSISHLVLIISSFSTTSCIITISV